MKNDPRGWWPEIGAEMMVGSEARGVVVEHHPQAFMVRLQMQEGMGDYGTTAWFDPDILTLLPAADDGQRMGNCADLKNCGPRCVFGLPGECVNGAKAVGVVADAVDVAQLEHGRNKVIGVNDVVQTHSPSKLAGTVQDGDVARDTWEGVVGVFHRGGEYFGIESGRVYPIKKASLHGVGGVLGYAAKYVFKGCA